MKKFSILCVVLLCMVLAACGHEHTWQAATCTAPKLCASCGETVGEALVHSWVDAACEIPQTCSVCGKTQGEPLGHTVSEWETSRAATCKKTGIETGTCSVCGETADRTIAEKDHTPGDWIITTEATPDSEGTRIQKCTGCSLILTSESYELSDSEIKRFYVTECKYISYDSLSRTPGQYEGEYVKFSGYVVQVCSEASSAFYYSTYRVATSGKYDDVVYIKVDNYGSGSRILEGDYITFYGKFDGLKTYETVLGANVTIPCVIVGYID